LLGELRHLGLLDADAIRLFAAEMGPRLAALGSREKVAAALVHAGLLTSYQRDRALAGAGYGLVLGNYRVLDRLNGGSVGVVFAGLHTALQRKVAIKTLPADADTRPDVLARFRAEMAALAQISHPHVVAVYDAGLLPPADPSQPALHYSVLEYLAGGDLEQFVYARGRQPVGVACEWGRQIAAGLAAAHAHGLVHRDLKPSNVLLTDDGRAKLTDFGLARHFASTLTPRPGVLGSLEFMAPEQLADPTTVGPAADVYGLGATLFWVLTGQLPYPKADTPAAQAKAITGGPPRRAKEVLPTLPDDVDKLIARLMTRFPASRPSAARAAADLAAFAAPAPTTGEAAALLGQGDEDRLRAAVSQLTDAVAAGRAAARDAAAAVLTALAEAARMRGERPGEQRRLQEYVRALAARLGRTPGWTQFSDVSYVDDVLRCVPVRNVGLVAVPDDLLAKPELTPAEQEAVERHTAHGAELVEAVARRHGAALGFLRVARAVVRSHHERWDGTGFPDKLARDQIPHPARLVALAEAYDTLRRPMPDGTPGLTHPEAVDGLIREAKSLFDPAVVDAFVAVNGQFDDVYATVPD
jgi:hypothetical protein